MESNQQTITLSEAKRNFSATVEMADESGHVVIVDNNRPKYVLTNLDIEPDMHLTDDEKIDIVARRILKRFKPAFIALVKQGEP